MEDAMTTEPQGGPTPGLTLGEQLCFPLYAASRLVTRLYQPLLAPLGITYPQYIVLMILWEEAPCPVSHIGQRANLGSNTLTPLLKRLEQLGYVRRCRSASDERVVEIHLTDSGQSLQQSAACIPQALFAAVGYPLEDALLLKAQLEKLMACLNAAPLPNSESGD